MKHIFTVIAVVLATLLPSLTSAGSAETTTAQLPQQKVARYAKQLEHDLAQRGANIAIVGRIGRDPDTLPTGIDYTHVAYWVYSQITKADGTTTKGYRVYNLYQTADDPTVSKLVQDSPAEFFAGVYQLDAGVIVPDPRLQKKLLSVISSPTYADLHNSDYSVLANPKTAQFQNCTEHTLDVLMASLYDTSDRGQIKANITAHFEPQPIRISGFKRLLAPVKSATLTTADHASDIGTATFGSIARFMVSHDLSEQVYRFTPKGAAPF